ncbi:DUF4333 domain-containing protein [Amycolatopsis sp. NBC_00355]|uniref:DUF4333 domain-containing protein n=1 Tax=Amycolatopsis sp. NBC_00355 TaxID=2975957 RepID=UPI002E25385A
MTRRFLVVLGLCCVLAGTACDAPAEPVPTPVLPTRSTPVPASAPAKVLDPAAVGDGVRKILLESFRIADVDGVTCPAGQPVVIGRAFACTAEIGGTAKRVPITVLGTDGRYRVDPPG